MKWLDSSDAVENASRARTFWSKLHDDLSSGQFWADRIKEFRAEPIQRLTLALNNLPLPAAFREAAIALRALIKVKEKSNTSYVDELVLLYWLAAIDSFSVPYSEVLRMPGYDVLESIPGSVIKSFQFEYSELGFERLKLLGPMDHKRIVKLWGHPRVHTSLHELHGAIWRSYESQLAHRRNALHNLRLEK